MRDWKNKLMLSRGSAKNIFASLALVLALSACSSKQGATADESSSDVQSESDLILGEDSSDALSTDELLESSALSPNSPSLPKSFSGSWKGSLKSHYEPGMTSWKVSRGESLSLIAGAVYGNAASWKKLAALNPELTDPNVLVPGQRLRLPSANGSVAQNDQESETAPNKPDAEKPQSPSQDELPSKGELSKVSNTADPDVSADQAESPTGAEAPAAGTVAAAQNSAAADPGAAAPAEGAMGVVDNSANTEAPATAATTAKDGALSNLVTKVDMSGNKLKLRNILLGIAAFFLLLSGVIFVLSRRKSKAA